MFSSYCHRVDVAVSHPHLALPRFHWPGYATLAIGLAAMLAILIVNAMARPLAPFDRSGIAAVQSIDVAGFAPVLELLDVLTGSPGAILAWVVVVGTFLVARWWAAAATVGLVPAGGLINEAIGQILVERVRPHDAELLRTSSNWEERSFPSGHVSGAVLLYGLVFVIAGQIPSRAMRSMVRVISATIVLTVGFQRVWEGAHWPSDVLASYALGGLLVLGLVGVYRRLEPATTGLPLIRAADIPHDETLPHAHALTSLVMFDGDRVSKTYAPGLIPRVLYWVAFQAPFPYIANEAALEAAMHRRNLAVALTRYWYGTPRVARVLTITKAGGRYRLVSERIVGHAPVDRVRAKAFLTDLSARFVEAGLPTWQIDPRQPRSLDNLIETAPGHYVVVDLESGLVAPLAFWTTWRQALARGIFPLFDTLLPDIATSYVRAQATSIRARLPESDYRDLQRLLAAAVTANARWRATEPRLWSRLLSAGLVIGNVRSWHPRLKAMSASGRQSVQSWLERAVDSWTIEGRLSPSAATRLRAAMADPAFQAALPYLGAHVLISVPLRFPFGSAVRPVLVLMALVVATGRLLTRRIDLPAWRLAWQLHSPLVMVLAALPMVGSFAYLASRPLRTDPILVRVALDALAMRVPWQLYQRAGLRSLIALPADQVRLVADAAAGPNSPLGSSVVQLPGSDRREPAAVGAGPEVPGDEPLRRPPSRLAMEAPIAS